ncbi:uncharacterized protein TRIADDRAFT_59667 [Trichoplax adhaerens]|uniref:Uncharacterized protein n=1 Tax=Trichoplax adhaerens TaxID=10228 RepID=B3S641_TRIAD|nr:predicted protein [Trichoplax adhaerens]EDV21693.1 predicted protein [Trichoplax adhaerens]|eukprot:XP_002115841.1 predicted protein [Trichoplax adhaerens]
MPSCMQSRCRGFIVHTGRFALALLVIAACLVNAIRSTYMFIIYNLKIYSIYERGIFGANMAVTGVSLANIVWVAISSGNKLGRMGTLRNSELQLRSYDEQECEDDDISLFNQSICGLTIFQLSLSQLIAGMILIALGIYSLFDSFWLFSTIPLYLAVSLLTSATLGITSRYKKTVYLAIWFRVLCLMSRALAPVSLCICTYGFIGYFNEKPTETIKLSIIFGGIGVSSLVAMMSSTLAAIVVQKYVGINLCSPGNSNSFYGSAHYKVGVCQIASGLLCLAAGIASMILLRGSYFTQFTYYVAVMAFSSGLCGIDVASKKSEATLSTFVIMSTYTVVTSLVNVALALIQYSSLQTLNLPFTPNMALYMLLACLISTALVFLSGFSGAVVCGMRMGICCSEDFRRRTMSFIRGRRPSFLRGRRPSFLNRNNDYQNRNDKKMAMAQSSARSGGAASV